VTRLPSQGPNTPILVKWSSLSDEWQNELIAAFGEPAKQIKPSLFEMHYELQAITDALHQYFEHFLPVLFWR